MSDTEGHQPQEDGRLQCLDCGRWYKLLAPHLAHAHDTTTAAYRQAHKLPRKLSLRAADLNETARQQGLTRYANRPDIRANMAAGRQAINPANAVAGTRETARYELVLDARRRAGAVKRAAAEQRMNNAAQTVGFADMRAYLAARPGVKAAAMARELGVPRTTVRTWIAKCAP